jgi:SAM-dependent methyltransferase
VRPKSSEVSYNNQFYDSLADVYLRGDRWTQLRMAQVLRMVVPQQGDHILDLGCASGATAHFCYQCGAQVTGVDSSALAIQKAKELFGNTTISFLERDVSHLYDIEDGSFDKAIATDLVEHINQDAFEGMIKESYRVLKPGGSLSIYTPNPDHIIERMKDRAFILTQNPTHIDIKTMERIVDTLTHAHFDIEMAYYTVSFIPVFKQLEFMLKPLPLVGRYFRYRICVKGVKK